VPVGFTIAQRLQVPFDLVLTKKIGHPLNPEYAIGAVGLEDSYIIPHDEVSAEYLEMAKEKVRRRLREMQALYKQGHPMLPIVGKTVIVVDDGIATGNTLLVTIRMLRKSKPARIVVAAPVSSRRALERLQQEADDCICLMVPSLFTGVGAFYKDFSEVTDEKVAGIMRQASSPVNE
jgi:predicted phosphoribosyltransferase